MGQHRVAGVTQNQTGHESGTAAYEDAGLHPRLARTGRYAAPEARYVYRGPKPVESLRFQKPVAIGARWAGMAPVAASTGAST